MSTFSRQLFKIMYSKCCRLNNLICRPLILFGRNISTDYNQGISDSLPARLYSPLCCLIHTNLIIHCQGKYVLVLVTVTVSVFPVHRSTTFVLSANILVSSLKDPKSSTSLSYTRLFTGRVASTV